MVPIGGARKPGHNYADYRDIFMERYRSVRCGNGQSWTDARSEVLTLRMALYRSVWKWAVVVRYRSVWKWAVVASRLPVRVAVEVDSRDQKLSDYEVCRDKVCATSLTAAAGVKSN